MITFDTFSPNAAARTSAYLVGSSNVTHDVTNLYSGLDTYSYTGTATNINTSSSNMDSNSTVSQSTAGTTHEAIGSTVERSTSMTVNRTGSAIGNGSTTQSQLTSTYSVGTTTSSSTYSTVNTRSEAGSNSYTYSYVATSSSYRHFEETSSQSSSQSAYNWESSSMSGATTNTLNASGSASSSFTTSYSGSTLVSFTNTYPHAVVENTTVTVATAYGTVASSVTNESVFSAQSTTSTRSELSANSGRDGYTFTTSEATITYTETTYSSVETTTVALDYDDSVDVTYSFLSTNTEDGTFTDPAFTDGNNHSTVCLLGNQYNDGRRAWEYSHLLDGITVALAGVESLSTVGKFGELFSSIGDEQFTIDGHRIYAEESYVVPVYTAGVSNTFSGTVGGGFANIIFHTIALTNGLHWSSAFSSSSSYTVTVNLGDVDEEVVDDITRLTYAATLSQYNTDSTWLWETYSTSVHFADSSSSEMVVPFYYQSVSTILAYASLSPEYSCPITYWSKETCESTTTAETTTSTDLSSSATTEGTRTLGICTTTLPVRAAVYTTVSIESYIAGLPLVSYSYTSASNFASSNPMPVGWTNFTTVSHAESIEYTSYNLTPLFPNLNAYGLFNEIYGAHNYHSVRAVVPWLPHGWAGFYRTIVSNYDEVIVGRGIGVTLVSGSELGTVFDTKNFTYAGATASLVQGRKVSVVHLEPKSVYGMESGGSFAGLFNSTYFSGTESTIKVTFTATTEKTNRLDGNTYEGATTALATYKIGLLETISGNFFLPVEHDEGFGDPESYYVRDFKPYHSTVNASTVTMGGVHGVTGEATYYANFGHVTYETYEKGASEAGGSNEVSSPDNTVSFALPASVAVRLHLEPHYTVAYGGGAPLLLEDTLYPS